MKTVHRALLVAALLALVGAVGVCATTVNIQFSGSVEYKLVGAGTWQPFVKPSMDLSQGTYTFKFDDKFSTDIVVGTSEVQKNAVILRLLNSSGSAVPGQSARGGNGTSYGTWFVPGTTDANGELFDFRDGLHGTKSYEMRYNRTAQNKTQDVAADSYILFQSVDGVVKLSGPSGGLAGGSIAFGPSTGNEGWWPGPATNASGESHAEVLPGRSYAFRMQYLGWTMYKYNNSIDSAPLRSQIIVEFQLTSVSVQFSGLVEYNHGGWKTFSSPTGLAPGTYPFRFDGKFETNIVVGTSAVEKSAVILKLTDSGGLPLSGGTARGGVGTSYWTYHVSGTTDASGELFDLRDGLHGTKSYEMRYNSTAQHKTQDVAANSYVLFQTLEAIVKLVDHSGGGLANGEIAFGSSTGNEGYWPERWTNASGEAAAEIFPGTYKFRMKFHGGTEYKSAVVAATPSTQVAVQFQTGRLQWNTQCPEPKTVNGGARSFVQNDELLPGVTEVLFKSSTCGTADPTLFTTLHNGCGDNHCDLGSNGSNHHVSWNDHTAERPRPVWRSRKLDRTGWHRQLLWLVDGASSWPSTRLVLPYRDDGDFVQGD